MTRNTSIRACGFTHTGKVRKLNEDAILLRPKQGFVAVADGMGGHNAGEIASEMAVQTIADALTQGLEQTAFSGADNSTGYAAESILLRDAISSANNAIYSAAKRNADYRGMGTTVVTALFRDGRISIAHAGDSRLYRFRDGVLEQLTLDHSVQQELASRAGVDPSTLQNTVNKNAITRALGIEESVQIDLLEEAVAACDIYLLCSDGLTNMVDDQSIGATLQQFGGKITAAARRLLAMANRAGGRDNISIVLVYINKSFAPAKKQADDDIDWFD